MAMGSSSDFESLGVVMRTDGTAFVPTLEDVSVAKEALSTMKRRNKFNAKPTQYKGRRYASKAEANRARALDQLVEAGAILGWEAQPSFELVEGFKYKPDFLVVNLDGTCHAEDVKGMETKRFRDSKRLWKAHGIMPLHVIFKDRTETVLPDRLLIETKD